MMFEYDHAKSKSNKNKHGIDFKEAQSLWSDEDALHLKARTDGEERYLIIGKIDEKLWTAVVPYRDDATRIISGRRSRKEEIDVYFSQEIR